MSTDPAEDVPPTPPAAEEKKEPFDLLEALVGVSVVLLATFLGLCNVKDGNIVQGMQQAQSDRNNEWLWFQARNLREEMYITAADEMRALAAGATGEGKAALESMAAVYDKKAKDQAGKKETQMNKADQAAKTYESLNELDDKFDISEAALAVGLAMMGVTALIKRWWMFFISLVPSAFGVYMGLAGFAAWEVPVKDMPVIGWIIRMIL